MRPRWLYESLPIIYIVIGVVMLAFESTGFASGALLSTIGFLSGLLAAFAGMLILAMRDTYRMHAHSNEGA